MGELPTFTDIVVIAASLLKIYRGSGIRALEAAPPPRCADLALSLTLRGFVTHNPPVVQHGEDGAASSSGSGSDFSPRSVWSSRAWASGRDGRRRAGTAVAFGRPRRAPRRLTAAVADAGAPARHEPGARGEED